MCGICCLFKKRTTISFEDDVVRKSTIQNRGPDKTGSHVVCVSEDISLLFGGFVLHLRGADTTPQPVTDDLNNTLVWNGEIFDGIHVNEKENDTHVLFNQLTTACGPEEIFAVLAKIQGPWAFIFWQASEKKLWFGRDVFGRRSLLWHLQQNDEDIFALSSVHITPHEFHEVPSIGVYCLDFSNPNSTETMTLYPWRDVVWPGTLDKVTKENISERTYQGSTCQQIKLHPTIAIPSWMPSLNKELPPPNYRVYENDSARSEDDFTDQLMSIMKSDSKLKAVVEQLMDVLEKAVHRRVFNLPRECKENGARGKCAAIREGIDDSPSEVGPMSERTTTERTQDKPMNLVGDGSGCARVAVLFSGGIDSTVLAALADRCAPKDEVIDLINVAFEQVPREHPQHNKKKDEKKVSSDNVNAVKDRFAVPDRLTGYVALSELNTDRTWNFVEVNVRQEELRDFRSRHISSLIYPLTSVLDDSIGCAVWFAARGTGVLGNGEHRGQQYQSQAKVILCGMGADEQLVGYSRHRTRFRDQGWEGVISEVDMEMQRISARNLGRDDRIIGDHGRESRFPFLDEDVVRFLAQLPMHMKADLTLARGVGEKLVLRLLALKLGLHSTATLPKRAIQFGSRIAKLENSKEKASDVCTRLKQL